MLTFTTHHTHPLPPSFFIPRLPEAWNLFLKGNYRLVISELSVHFPLILLKLWTDVQSWHHSHWEISCLVIREELTDMCLIWSSPTQAMNLRLALPQGTRQKGAMDKQLISGSSFKSPGRRLCDSPSPCPNWVLTGGEKRCREACEMFRCRRDLEGDMEHVPSLTTSRLRLNL